MRSRKKARRKLFVISVITLSSKWRCNVAFFRFFHRMKIYCTCDVLHASNRVLVRAYVARKRVTLGLESGKKDKRMRDLCERCEMWAKAVGVKRTE